MQRKTINKVIRAKMEEWLSTINDSDLAKKVRSCILVSGGCITSMYLDQPVNDFDVYMTDKSVLKDLAKYYGGPLHFGVLDGEEQEAIIKRYLSEKFGAGEYERRLKEYWPDDLCELAVRYKNLKPDQIKLDLDSAGFRVELMAEQKEAKKYLPVFFSPNAISLTDNVQIVLRFSGSAEEIHKNFDFIHATNYWTFEKGLVVNSEALESVLTKELKYQGSLYPLTSMIRIKKFVRKGWTINAGEMLKIMFQVADLDLRDIVVLEEQLIGIDIAYFSTLINILRGVNREKLDSHYVNTIIDRVFNQSNDDEQTENQNQETPPFEGDFPTNIINPEN